ncbi:uncharacterized protein LOC119282417 [Triticum dicoccoides]|uniref:uncharacterized protein LOC119282417 n=1 Tax=Triticum dicoccoides TaxID=85692 RepID=UPI00188E54DC|nr:uncharacterized protein LOC119282417 [Triticum dicoccoides]
MAPAAVVGEASGKTTTTGEVSEKKRRRVVLSSLGAMSLRTAMKPEAWTTTGEEGEEQWDQDEREVLEFEEEAWKISAKGGESTTVKLAGEESFSEHDPAGAVIMDDVPSFLR